MTGVQTCALPILVAGTKTTNLSAQTLYVKVGTAVAGGTVDIYVYGYDFGSF